MRHLGNSANPVVPRLAWVALLLLLVPACTLLDPEVGVPDRARVFLSGSSAAQLEVIISTDFVRAAAEGGSSEVSLTRADTFYTDLSTTHDQVYQVAPKNRFFVRVSNPDTALAIVTLKIWMDGDLKYEHEEYTLREASMEFSRIYNDWGY